MGMVDSVRERAAGSQISPQGLLALDRLEQRLEVPLPEAARALPLDDLVEHGGTVLDGLREDLEEIAVGVAVDEDPELREPVERLVDPADALLEIGVVRRRHREELDAALAQRADRREDVVRGEREVLHAGPAVELEILVDLRLLLALRRLVDRELDALVPARDDLRHQ